MHRHALCYNWGSMARNALRRAARAFGAALRDLAAHETPGVAAAISYFTLFALFPAILALGGFVDAFLGWTNLHDPVLQRVLALFPAARRDLAANLAQISAPSAAVLVSCIIMTLWSSTWVLLYVEKALNRAWGVRRRRTFWQSRLRSLTLLTLSGVLLLCSAILTAGVSTVQSYAAHRVPERADQILNRVSSSFFLALGFGAALIVFFLIYKLMPDRSVQWFEAISGAVAAAILWEIASYIFAKLLPWFDYERVYGKMGALIAVMSWVYTSTLIMLVGGHFSARLHTPRIDRSSVPADYARDFERHSPGPGTVRKFVRR